MSDMEKIFDKIAERKLTLKDDVTAQQSEIKIQIGRPYWLDFGIDAACPVRIEGLLDEGQDILGVDELGALQSAMSFINSYLSNLPSTKTVYWPDGEVYLDG